MGGANRERDEWVGLTERGMSGWANGERGEWVGLTAVIAYTRAQVHGSADPSGVVLQYLISGW